MAIIHGNGTVGFGGVKAPNVKLSNDFEPGIEFGNINPNDSIESAIGKLSNMTWKPVSITTPGSTTWIKIYSGQAYKDSAIVGDTYKVQCFISGGLDNSVDYSVLTLTSEKGADTITSNLSVNTIVGSSSVDGRLLFGYVVNADGTYDVYVTVPTNVDIMISEVFRYHSVGVNAFGISVVESDTTPVGLVNVVPNKTATEEYVDGLLVTMSDEIDLKAPIDSPTFTGIVKSPNPDGASNDDTVATTSFVKTSIITASVEIPFSDTDPLINGVVTSGTSEFVSRADHVHPVDTTRASATDLNTLSDEVDLKAPIDSPTFTGTVGGISKDMVGLGNVDNTSDLDKPISTAAQTALDLKAPIDSPAFTGTVTGISKDMVGLGNVDNTSDLDKPISTETQTAINTINTTLGDKADQIDLDTLSDNVDLKAPIESPTFTGEPKSVTPTTGDNSTNIATTEFVNASIAGKANKPIVGSITLETANWVASGSDWTQSPTIAGLTATHRIDIQQTPILVRQLANDGVTGLLPSNDGGVATITAMDVKPSMDIVVPYTLMDVTI